MLRWLKFVHFQQNYSKNGLDHKKPLTKLTDYNVNRNINFVDDGLTDEQVKGQPLDRKNFEINRFLRENGEKNISTQGPCIYFVTENVKKIF